MGEPTREELLAEIVRLKAELAARENAAPKPDLLLQLLDHVPDLIWAKDLEKNYLFANRATCDKLLCAEHPRDVPGRTDLDFAERQRKTHPDNPEWHTFGEICTDSDDVVLREKALEKALARSEKRYRSIFDQAPFGILLADADGVIREANEAFASLIGYPLNNLIGKSYHELVDPADAERLRTQVENLQQGRIEQLDFEIFARAANGQRLRLKVRGALVRLHPDEPPCQLGMVQDITRQHAAEEQVKAERNRFYNVLEHLPALIYLQAPDHSIPFANQTFTRRFGDFRRAPCYRIIHDRQSPCVPCSTFDVFSSGKPRRWDMHDDTRDAYFEIHEIPFEDSDGSPLVMVLGIDVTKRRKARLALEQSEKEQRLLLAQMETIPDGLILFDRQGKTLWANRHVTRLLRLEAPPLPGTPCGKGRCPEGHCQNCPVPPCLEDGRFREQKFLDSDGREIHCRCFPIRSEEGGEVERVILHISDTSRHLNERINHLRAGQLAAVGELAAGIAHEINNPLNGVLNYAQIIANDPDVLHQHPQIPQKILADGERIAAIVSGLLGFTRTTDDNRSPIDITDLFKDVLLLVETQMRVEGIRVEVSMDANLPLIPGHAQKLEQVLFNLLSNARHAVNLRYPRPDEAKRIWIGAKRRDEWLRIRIDDSGVGIAAEDLPHLCSPFFTTKPEGEGTGLGLSICWQIIQEHRGRLSFESEPGCGTSVLLELPLPPAT